MTDRSSDDKSSDNAVTARKSAVRDNWLRINENIARIKAKNGITEEVEICAATKTVDAELINYAAELGLARIGENRVNELLVKYGELDCEKLKVDFIGTLQTNKISKLVGKVDLIQSLDNERAAKELDRLSGARGLTSKILIEINIGRETGKSGIMPEETSDFIDKLARYKNLEIKGIMTIGAVCGELSITRKYFEETYRIFIDIYKNKLHNIATPVLSMGMSSDYEIAVECGSNMIRPGRALFGERIYNV